MTGIRVRHSFLARFMLAALLLVAGCSLLAVYLLLFIPFFRAWFHRLRVAHYFSRIHVRRHNLENALIAGGSLQAVVPLPGQIVSYDFRDAPAPRAPRSPSQLSSSSSAYGDTFAAFGTTPSPDSRAGQVRVVSWNLEYGYRLAAILDELKRLDADVICLQECDSFRDLPHAVAVDVVAYLARQLRMTAVWAGHHAYGSTAGPVFGIWGCGASVTYRRILIF